MSSQAAPIRTLAQEIEVLSLDLIGLEIRVLQLAHQYGADDTAASVHLRMRVSLAQHNLHAAMDALGLSEEPDTLHRAFAEQDAAHRCTATHDEGMRCTRQQGHSQPHRGPHRVLAVQW